MDRETSALLLKSNRILGTRLVEAGLCSLNDLDLANQLFVERVRANDLKKASLLRILIFEKQVVNESTLIDYQFDTYSIGGLSLDSFELNEGVLNLVEPEKMLATWTLPIDTVDNHTFLATAYYLSDVVRQFWEERLSGGVTWYLATVSEMETYLDRFLCMDKKEEAE